MYNVAQYLPKCIESVFNEDVDNFEFEIILIDDGSIDDSLETAKKLTYGKENVKIISQKNKGLGGARNTGIENANGNYILFLDSDDTITKSALKECSILAKSNNLDVLEFGAQGINDENKRIYLITASTEGKILNGVDYYSNVRYMDSACNKLYQREFLNINNLRFIEKIFIEDYEFNTRVLYLAKRVMATPILVSSFLQTSNSITRNNNPEKKEKMKQDILQVIKIIKEGKENALPEKEFFFNQRLSYLTTTLFYQLLKNKATYSEFVHLRKKMIEEKLFFTTYTILDKKKNFFRLFFLKNFFLLRLLTKK